MTVHELVEWLMKVENQNAIVYRATKEGYEPEEVMNVIKLAIGVMID